MFLDLDDPKSKAIYEKANQNIEKFSGIIYLAMVKGTPACLVAPKFIACLIVYSSTNENEALELPLPMWYLYSLSYYTHSQN